MRSGAMEPRLRSRLIILAIICSLYTVSIRASGDTLEKSDTSVQKSNSALADQPNTESSSSLANNVSLVSGIREKRQESRQGYREPRTFDVDIGVGPVGPPPLCFEREVSGTCRYRSSPEECFRHEWTAYATIINQGFKTITSKPDGLWVTPGGHPRVRVFLKSSCCTPIVHFIATDIFLQKTACIVDVRELQDLHPGEIVGIAVGSLLFVIVVIIVIALCIRYQRRKKLEKETVIFGRSLTRSKSGNGSFNHR